MLLSLVPTAGSILLPRLDGNHCVPATQLQHFWEMTGAGPGNAVRIGCASAI